jgi:peptide/nickel transport system permease protein
MALLTFILKRLMMMIPVLFGMSILVFSLIHLVPGDPARVMLGLTATPENIQTLREEMGLNDPLWRQYGDWAWKVLHGDLGTDFRSHEPLTQMLMSRLPVTLELTLLAVLMSVTISIPLGIAAAARQNKAANIASNGLGMIGISVPDFWFGVLLILVFSKFLGWLPPSGYRPISEGLIENLRYMVLPSLTLAIAMAAVLTRTTRAAMLETLDQDFIRFARAKGIRERLVVYKHALRNAAIPILTVLGLQFGYLLGGAVVVETLFSLPGIGRMTLNAVNTRSYTIVQGGVLFIGVTFMLVNLITDVLYAVLNPRIRLENS